MANNNQSKSKTSSKSKNYNKSTLASKGKTEEKHTIASSDSSVKVAGSKSNNDKDSKFVKHVWWLDALLFIGGTIVLGGIATLLGGKMFSFGNYQMPQGIVPKIVFPIAWAIIYIAIGVATFLMWRDKEIKASDRKINLIIYFVHMFFNIMWPLFFFRLDLPIFATVWLLLTVASACIVMYRYFVCNLPAGIIFSIYTLWLIYALYLNLAISIINF